MNPSGHGYFFNPGDPAALPELGNITEETSHLPNSHKDRIKKEELDVAIMQSGGGTPNNPLHLVVLPVHLHRILSPVAH